MSSPAEIIGRICDEDKPDECFIILRDSTGRVWVGQMNLWPKNRPIVPATMFIEFGKK